MAASGTNPWLQSSLLAPSGQQLSTQRALYTTGLPILHHSSQMAQHQHAGLEQDVQHPFCKPHECPLNLDFQQSAGSPQMHELSRPSGGSCSGHVGAGGDCVGHVSARKVHKADREKLRRDRLNEQFAELAGVLDPDRPKNDKATVLGDSVQVVKELRSEVKRLRTEQLSLLDESRDLTKEKTELREEKAALKSETELLQVQIQQRLRLMLPWMGMDPSIMMAAPPFAYPMPVPQAVSSASPPSDLNHPASQRSLQQAVATTPTFIPLAPPTPPGAFGYHPSLQAYTMFANRPLEGGTPHLPYAHYPSQVSSHPHVERPYAQYPSSMQPLPGYLMQMHPHQGQTPLSGPPPVPSMYQSFAAGIQPMPARTQGTESTAQSRGENAHVAPGAPFGIPGSQPVVDHSGSSSVQTTLQLLTPLHPQPPKPTQVGPANSLDESLKAQSGGTGCSGSRPQIENQSAAQDAPSGSSTAPSPTATASPNLCTSGPSAGGSGRNDVDQCAKDIGSTQQKDSLE